MLFSGGKLNISKMQNGSKRAEYRFLINYWGSKQGLSKTNKREIYILNPVEVRTPAHGDLCPQYPWPSLYSYTLLRCLLPPGHRFCFDWDNEIDVDCLVCIFQRPIPNKKRSVQVSSITREPKPISYETYKKQENNYTPRSAKLVETVIVPLRVCYPDYTWSLQKIGSDCSTRYSTICVKLDFHKLAKTAVQTTKIQ